MSSLIKKLVNLFIDPQDLTFFETSVLVNLDAKSSELKFPDFENFLLIKNAFSQRDTFSIEIIIDENEPILLLSKQLDQFASFMDESKRKFQIKENVLFTLKLKIYKGNSSIQSVYFTDSFIKYLTHLPIQEVLSVFKANLNGQFQTQFVFIEGDINIQTSMFSFLSTDYTHILRPEINRKKRLEQANTLCHCKLLSDYDFIPDDFNLLEDNKSIPELSNLLNLLKFTFSVACIFDIIDIENSTLSYKLNGYKSINGKIGLKDLNLGNASNYFEIYKWTYNEGNQIDKIGLARNILTLHLDTQDLGIQESVLPSIISSHNIYLKQNIKQYIEIRNKVGDQLIEFHNKADKIVENFANDFKKSLFAFLSFFASVIIIQVLRNGNFISVFTIDATLLSITFLAVMTFFLLASSWELKEQRKRYEMMYASIKKRSKDILDDIDVEKILDNDSYYNKELTFLREKGRKYKTVWIATIVIFFITVIMLFFINSVTEFISHLLTHC